MKHKKAENEAAERRRKALAMLKILALSEKDIRAGRVFTTEQVFKNAERAIKRVERQRKKHRN